MDSRWTVGAQCKVLLSIVGIWVAMVSVIFTARGSMSIRAETWSQFLTYHQAITVTV